jgi:hypothetical protein
MSWACEKDEQDIAKEAETRIDVYDWDIKIHHATFKITIGHSPFRLTYGLEAILSLEFEMMILRTKTKIMVKLDESQKKR